MNESKINSTSQMGEKQLPKNLAVSRVLDYVIEGVIVAVFFLIPLFFTGLTAQGFGFDKIILFYFLVLLGVIAWATKGVVTGELSLKRTPLDIPILVVLGIFIISTFTSISPKDSLVGSYGNSAKGLIAVIVYVLFYYLVVNNINLKRIKSYFGAVVLSGVLLSIYSLLQISGKYILPMGLTHSQSVNPIGSLSGLTMYLVIILPLLVVAVAQTEKIFPNISKNTLLALRIVLGLSIITSIAVLALLNGFTFWPVSIIGMVVLLMFFMSKIIKISTVNLMIPLGTFLVLVIFLVMGNFQLSKANLPAEVSLSRSASWGIAKSAIRENPILGSGLSTFEYDFSKFKNINFNASPLWNVRFDTSTGSFFELLATVGIPGTIMLVILFLISLSVSFLTLIKNGDSESNSILLGLFASLISTALLSVWLPQNNSLIILSVIISILCVAASIEMYPEKFKSLKLSFRAEAKYALALAAIFLTVTSGVVVSIAMGLKMYLADVYAKESLSITDPALVDQKLNQVLGLVSYQDAYYLTSANNLMAMANQAAIAGGDQAVVAENLKKAIAQGEKALEYAPKKVGNNESLALIYENASFYTRGALENAQKLYQQITELDPQNPTAYLRMALVNMAKANIEAKEEDKKYYIEEAIKRYDEAIAKKGDLAAAYYGKSIANEKLNKLDDAIEQLRNAVNFSRENLDYRFELGRLYFNRGVTNPKMSQNASQEIAGGTDNGQNLSVQPDQTNGGKIDRNADINTAEQLFLSILLDPAQGGNPNHANARYSLAVLYQKIGENDKAKLMVDYLLKNVLQDQKTKDAVTEQFKNL